MNLPRMGGSLDAPSVDSEREAKRRRKRSKMGRGQLDGQAEAAARTCVCTWPFRRHFADLRRLSSPPQPSHSLTPPANAHFVICINRVANAPCMSFALEPYVRIAESYDKFWRLCQHITTKS